MDMFYHLYFVLSDLSQKKANVDLKVSVFYISSLTLFTYLTGVPIVS